MRKNAPKSRSKPNENTEKRYSFQDYATELANSLMTMIPRAWEKPWAPGHAPDGLALPFNAITGVEYKGSNTFVLLSRQMANGYSDPRWLTYRQAQELGGHVTKGQKGTTCVKWIFKDVEELRPDGSKEKVERGFPSFFTLFNAAQCEGIPPLPVREPVAESFRHEECERLLSECGAKIANDGGDRAYYRPSSDSIHLPTKEAFAAKGPGGVDHYYSTAFHEVSHWTGAPHRLNRDLSGRFGSVEYAKEELRAEIGSMLVGARLGIGRDPEHIANHHAYLKHWLDIAKSDPQEVVRACRDAEKICQFLNIPVPEHTPTVKAPVLDQALVERGSIIADMHGVQIDRFEQGSPQEEALGKGWGYTGSGTFPFADGGHASREACFQAIAEKHGTSIANQIPRNVQVGMEENGVWTPYKIIDILDSGTAVVVDERNRTKAPALIDLASLHAEEDGQRYRFQDMIRGVEIAQQGGMRVGRDRDDHGWQLYGTDSHPVLLGRQPTFPTQLAALDWLNSHTPRKTDRDLGEDLRQRLRGAQAFGSREAGEAWEALVQRHGNEYDAVAKAGAAIRDGSLASQEWPQAVRATIQSVRQENGLVRPERRPEPALSL